LRINSEVTPVLDFGFFSAFLNLVIIFSLFAILILLVSAFPPLNLAKQ